jgi:hypothetical protein
VAPDGSAAIPRSCDGNRWNLTRPREMLIKIAVAAKSRFFDAETLRLVEPIEGWP